MPAENFGVITAETFGFGNKSLSMFYMPSSWFIVVVVVDDDDDDVFDDDVVVVVVVNGPGGSERK